MTLQELRDELDRIIAASKTVDVVVAHDDRFGDAVKSGISYIEKVGATVIIHIDD